MLARLMQVEPTSQRDTYTPPPLKKIEYPVLSTGRSVCAVRVTNESCAATVSLAEKVMLVGGGGGGLVGCGAGVLVGSGVSVAPGGGVSVDPNVGVGVSVEPGGGGAVGEVPPIGPEAPPPAEVAVTPFPVRESPEPPDCGWRLRISAALAVPTSSSASTAISTLMSNLRGLFVSVGLVESPIGCEGGRAGTVGVENGLKAGWPAFAWETPADG